LARLGKINFYGKARRRVIDRVESVFVRYTGQKVYNFEFDFIIPSYDAELERIIRLWNEGNGASIGEIMSRIEELGGIHFIWY
jgi:hypothetical protein